MPIYTTPNGKKYEFDNRTEAKDFENDYPDAKVELYNGDDHYNVPLRNVDAFFKKYPDGDYWSTLRANQPDPVENPSTTEEQKPSFWNNVGNFIDKISQGTGMSKATMSGTPLQENAPEEQSVETSPVSDLQQKQQQLNEAKERGNIVTTTEKQDFSDNAFNVAQIGKQQEQPRFDYRQAENKFVNPAAKEKAMPTITDIDKLAEEESRIQFTPKKVEKDSDILDNAKGRFSQTEEGQVLQAEADEASKQHLIQLTEEFAKTSEYKDITAKKPKNEQELKEMNEKLNAEFDRMYGDEYVSFMAPYQQRINEAMFDRYGASIADEQQKLQKEQIGAKVSDLTGKINDAMEEHRKKNRINAGSGGNAMNALMASKQNIVRNDPDMLKLRAADHLMEQANEVLDAVKNGDENIIKQFGRGFWDNLDTRNFSFGVSDMVDTATLLSTLKKAEKGEKLTDAEEKLLEAQVTNMAVMGFYGSDLSRAYKAGQTTGVSLPYMLEFIANPISGSGNAIAKSLLNWGAKKFGAKIAERSVSKLAAGLFGQAAAAAGMVETSSAPRVASGAMERLAGNYEINLNDKGKPQVFKTGNMSDWEAVSRESRVVFAEDLSEMIFNAFKGFNPFEKVAMPEQVKNFMDMISKNGVAKFVNKISNSKTYRQIADRAQFHGWVEEPAEEVLDNLAEVAMGEMTLEQATSLDTNLDIIMGLAPTSLAFSMIGLGSLAHEKRQNRKKMESAFGKLNNEQKNRLAELQEMAANENNDFNATVKNFMEYTINDKSLTQEERRAELEYLYESVKANEIDKIDAERTPEQKVQDGVEEAEMEGAEAVEPADMNSIGVDLEVATQEMNNTFGATTRTMFDADPMAAAADVMNNPNYTAEEKQVAIDYLNAKTAYNSMIGRIREDIGREVEESNAEIDSRTDADTGAVRPATLKNGNRQVYIMNGNVVMYEDGSGVDLGNSSKDVIVKDAETGKLEFIPASDISSIEQPISAEQLKEETAANIQQTKAQEEADKINGTLAFQQGDTYQAMGEDGTQVELTIISDNGDGSVNVGINGEAAAVPMAKETVQQMADRFKQQQAQKASIERRAATAVEEQAAEPVLDEAVEQSPVQEEAAPVAEKTVTEAAPETVEEQEEPMPMMGEGDNIQPDYGAATPQRTSRYIYDENGLDEKDADQLVQMKRKAAEKVLSDTKKAKPEFGEKGIGDNIVKLKQARAAWEQSVADAQRQVDYWNAVEQEHAMAVRHREDAAKSEATEPTEPNESVRAEEVKASNKYKNKNSELPNETDNAASTLGSSATSEDKDITSSDNIQTNQQENESLRQIPDEKQPLRDKAKEWEKKVGVKVTLVESVDELPANSLAAKAIKAGKNVQGWYNITRDSVYIYVPNVESESEIDKTYMHEVVAHKGLRQLLGTDAFNKLCDDVFASMSEEAKEKYINYQGVSDLEGKERERAAADEYMAALAEKTDLNPTLWEKIVAAVREALRQLGVDVEMTDDDIAYILNRSYDNLVEANADLLREKGAEVDTERGDVRFAVKDILKGKELDNTVKELMAVTGRSESTVKKWIKAEESLAKVILDDDNVKFLDMQVDESVPSIWNNSDYPQGTVEFSNICRKRLPFTMIYQRLQKEFPNMVFDASTLEDIRNTMKQNGADVACGLCYVEDRRQLLGEIGEGFISSIKNDYMPIPKKGKKKDISEKEAKKVNAKQTQALQILKESGDNYIPNLYDLLALDGMKKLRREHPSVAQAFVEYNNARGMQAGRLFQAYSAYHREILSYPPSKVKSINDNGGLRIFSFSDFEAHHLIDLVQVLTDAASKGIKVQGYTKVPEFAKAVKDTKMKLNRSLIAKDKGYVDADYQPKEGEAVSPNVIDGKRLLLDTVEGINVNHPEFFDSTDNANVGNILVGINDEQIKLAMRDPFVDYIIPFHSGLSENIRQKKGIGEWVNYKLKQLEKKQNEDGKLTNADKHGINIYTDVLPRGNELIGHEIKNARDFQKAFLAACAEKGWIPRFWEFIDKDKKGNYKYTPGYEKMLIDFKLFDKNGKIVPQEAVVPVFDNDFNKQILDDYVKGEKEKMPNDELYEKVKESLGLAEGEETRFRISDEEQKIEKDAKADGTWMKAPNGQPSNLNERQWVHVRTKAFKKWFGDWESDAANASKVVDENGEPKLVYHNTDLNSWLNRENEGKPFNIFNAGRVEGTGFFNLAHFGTKEQAEKRTEYKVERNKLREELGLEPAYKVYQYAVYLNLRNPKRVKDFGGKEDAWWDAAIKAQKDGYDGLVYSNEHEGKGDSYAVFSPNQIKSATENEGTFDESNPDIRFRVTPEEDAEYMDAVNSGDMEKAAEMVKAAAKKAMPDTKVVDENGNPMVVYHGTTVEDSDNPVQSIDGMPFTVFYDDSHFGSKEQATEMMNLRKEDYGGGVSHIYPVFLNIKNLARTEDAGDYWQDRLNNLKDRGFDGAVYSNEHEASGDSYIAFYPNQIKSAEPVTYDDEGKVIPLSERFNPENSDIRFRVDEDKTLMGVHNISETKLKKAIKNGGLANPSLAVIDTRNGMHNDFGEISLIPKSSLIDKRTGRNAGTYAGDAWTPSYPTVEKRMTDKGESEAWKDMREAMNGEDERGIMSETRRIFNDYLQDDRSPDRLAYWFFKEKGVQPEIIRYDSGVSEEDKQLFNEHVGDARSFTELDEQGRDVVLRLMANAEGKTVEEMLATYQRIKENMQRKLVEDPKPMFKVTRERTIEQIENYGVITSNADNVMGKVRAAMYQDGKVNVQETLLNAVNQMREGNQNEFDNWLDGKEQKYGVEEYIFNGYTPSGKRRYVRNTVENVSKLMNKESERNAGNDSGFGAFRSILMDKYGSLAEIRRNKDKLKKGDDIKEEVDKMSDELFGIIKQLADMKQLSSNPFTNVSYADARLQEAVATSDPIGYLNRVYGYNIPKDGEFAKKLSDIIAKVVTTPVKYFETKFNRPVRLNEFAIAVVPENTSEDVVKALQDAGLDVRTYDGTEEGRTNATMEAADDRDDIRFRVDEKETTMRDALADKLNEVGIKTSVAPVYYSNAEKAVQDIKQEKATPEQWLKMIEKNGGLKQGEDKWTGLSDYLKNSKAKSLTKQEVLDYINQNKIQVEEVRYNDEADYKPATDDELNEFNDMVDSLIEQGEDGFDAEDHALDALNKKYGKTFEYNGEDLYVVNKRGIEDIRLEYTTGGLDNRREIALVIPTIDPWNVFDRIHFGDAGEGRAVAWIRFGETTTSPNSEYAAQHILDDLEKKYGTSRLDYDKMSDEDVARKEFADYVSRDEFADVEESKYGIESSVGKERAERIIPIFEKLVRDNAKGERVLVIDEIQSKRHQEGRESGYKSELASSPKGRWVEAVKSSDSFSKEMRQKYGDNYLLDQLTEEERKRHEELVKELNEASNYQDEKLYNIPDAPFEKNWHELAMKRMLRYAAENGYDKVAWTKGEQQAERYSLAKTIPSITRQDTKKASEKGIRAFSMDINGEPQKIFVNNDGTITNTTLFMDEVSGKPLSDFVGKEIAVKMMAMNDGETIDTSKEKVGGEGMKGFYDEMLPRFMNKYGKKWGVKVGEVDLPNIEEAGQKMWSVDVTPEMKESVMEGQPMFFRTSNGQVYGYTLNGKIYIDPRIATAETPIHEFAHLWAEALRRGNAEEWSNVVNLMKGTSIWNEVANNYPELNTDDLLAEEVLAHYSGRRGAARLRKAQEDAMNNANGVFEKAEVASMFDSVRRALNRFWKAVADFLNIHYTSAEEVADRVLNDLLSGVNPNEAASIDGDAEVRFRVIDDQETIDRLESEPKGEPGYRNVVLNEDGTLGSPMAGKLGGNNGRKATSSFEMNKWEMAEENPDIANENGKVDLIKPNGKTVPSVDYNPYIHIRPTMVNKQFKEAWRRPELVYVKTLYPASELNGEYKAEKAKLSVGRHPWNGGELILSRYDKPVEIMSWEKVADDWMYEFDGKGIHFDIIPPKLLPILAERGAKIIPPHKNLGKECEDAYNAFKEQQEPSGDIRFSIDESKNIEDVNRKFNDELKQQIEGTLPKEHVYNLGMPSEILLSTGFPNLPIELSATHLAEKAAQRSHDYELADVKNLVNAIQNPIAVFEYGDKSKSQNAIVEIEHDGKHFVVGVHFNQKRGGAEVSSIRGLFPKDNAEWLNWISQGKLLYADKEKIQTLIDQQRTNLADVEYLDLDSIANIVQDFENPKLSEEKSSEKVRSKVNDEIRFSISDDVANEINGKEYNAGVKTFDEAITEGLAELVRRNKDAVQTRADVLHRINNQLRDLIDRLTSREAAEVDTPTPRLQVPGSVRSAASAQRAYDKSTVDEIVRLTRMLLSKGFIGELPAYEVKRLMGYVNNAVGRKDIIKQAKLVVDLLLKRQLDDAAKALEKQLSVHGSKVGSKGVEVQGRLDVAGQIAMKAFKDYKGKSNETIDNRIEDCIDRMSEEGSRGADAAAEYQGLMMAKRYNEDIVASEEEEFNMMKEIDDEAKKIENGDPEAMSKEEFDEWKEATEEAIRKNRMDRLDAYVGLLRDFGGALSLSVEKAKAFREAEQSRVRKICHYANSDLEGVPSDEHSKLNFKQWLYNTAVFRGFLLPMANFDSMLRFFGRKSPEGKGYLWNYFMSEWVKRNDEEWKNLKKGHEELDAKVRKIFRHEIDKWSDLFTIERGMKKVPVEFRDGKEVKSHDLTQGNLLYIYMVNKMEDGKMKLRKMGISEEDVVRIKEVLDPRFIQLADWIQDVFLKEKRVRYNEIHEKLFGAPMASIDNYFPLITNKRSRNTKVDIAEQKGENTPSTITGNIIKRVKNSTALDITNVDAFDVVLAHLQQMEHWAAFASLNNDMNTLTSYRHFTNQVYNMASAQYGSGKKLLDNFKNVCAIAGGAYKPSVGQDSIDRQIVNVAKGVTAAKIALRVFTALKQLLSYPAYFSEASVAELAKSTLNPFALAESWNWAIEKLPGFAERWQSRKAGDNRLDPTEMDYSFWRNRIVDTASRWGMSPNAFVDALTVTMGAKAIYETKKKQYIKDGYDEARAEELALRDASVAYNETQQSSGKAYLSPMQLDRTVASVALTVFRNSSMGYQRRLNNSLRNLSRMIKPGYRDESVAFTEKQLTRDGLLGSIKQRLIAQGMTEEQAQNEAQQSVHETAEKVYNRALTKSMADVVIFGFIMQFAWNLGSYMPYLIGGDDDDKKKELLDDAARHALVGGIEGMAGGSVLSDIYQKVRKGDNMSGYNINPLPLMSDIQNTLKKVQSDRLYTINNAVNILMQSLVGVNPETITDIVLAFDDATNGNLDLLTEFSMLMMRLASFPQSQLEELYIDELDLNGKDAVQKNPVELARRYARYKSKRSAPLLYWMYSDMEKDKMMKSYMDKFDDKKKERVLLGGDPEVKGIIEDYKNSDAYRNADETEEWIKSVPEEQRDDLREELRSTESGAMHKAIKKADTKINAFAKKGNVKAVEYLRSEMARMIEGKISVEDFEDEVSGFSE